MCRCVGVGVCVCVCIGACVGVCGYAIIERWYRTWSRDKKHLPTYLRVRNTYVKFGGFRSKVNVLTVLTDHITNRRYV